MSRRTPPGTVVGKSQEAVDAFIANDELIRAGKCPNGCGLMIRETWGQQCPECKFFCNTKPDTDH